MVDYPDFYMIGLTLGEAQVYRGEMKTMVGIAENLAAGDQEKVIEYTVPSGKNLYITCMQCAQYECATDESANYQAYAGSIYFLILSTSSSNPSAVATFPSPVRIDSGDTIRAYIINTGSVTGNFYLTVVGYLL